VTRPGDERATSGAAPTPARRIERCHRPSPMSDLRTPMPDLRTMRKRLSLSQAELAARLGVSRSTIIDRELGRVAISRETILAMRFG